MPITIRTVMETASYIHIYQMQKKNMNMFPSYAYGQ